MTLKSNHPTVYSQVKTWFDAAKSKNFEGINVSHERRIEKGHHRREKRLVWAVPLSEFGGLYKQEQWLGLQSIVMIERTRHLWNQVTHEVHFYLSSLPADAQVLGNAIRTHWGIEKRCPHSGINDPAEVSSARQRRIVRRMYAHQETKFIGL